jgi:hypothetical protein
MKTLCITKRYAESARISGRPARVRVGGGEFMGEVCTTISDRNIL